MSLVTRDISVDWGVSGLAGTLTYNVVDSQDADLLAASSAGVTEFPAGSGIYHKRITTWDPTWIGRIIWRDGSSGVGHFVEEAFDAMPATATALLGSGAAQHTVTVTKEGGVAVADADVWVTSDSAGTSVVAGTLQTNSQGKATFLLDAGVTYYLWMEKDGVNPILGEAFVAVAD